MKNLDRKAKLFQKLLKSKKKCRVERDERDSIASKYKKINRKDMGDGRYERYIRIYEDIWGCLGMFNYVWGFKTFKFHQDFFLNYLLEKLLKCPL